MLIMCELVYELQIQWDDLIGWTYRYTTPSHIYPTLNGLVVKDLAIDITGIEESEGEEEEEDDDDDEEGDEMQEGSDDEAEEVDSSDEEEDGKEEEEEEEGEFDGINEVMCFQLTNFY